MATLNLQQQLKLGLKLTPQQVQYLKLLQLPTLALEQRIKMELELNPMLEIGEEPDLSIEQEEPTEETPLNNEEKEDTIEHDTYTLEDYMNDDLAGYKSPEAVNPDSDDEEWEPPFPAEVPLSEKLLSQFKLLDVDDEETLLAEEILGNVNEDGYLSRDLGLIVQDLNLSFGLSISLEKAEQVLQKILLLDPPGIAARSLQECLIAQLRAGSYPHALKELCIKVIRDHFDTFKLKRYEQLQKELNISRDTLKKVVETIQHLNPKPGEGKFTTHENYVTPDFIVEKDNGDFTIILNDRNIPPLRINNAYKEIIMQKGKKASPEAKEFVKKKFEAAKWFIASIYQRRETLLKVMRAIVEKQRQWFEEGEVLKPMIYKDVADIVGVDISTISRVVNSKYVQTEFGVYPLRFFFTSGLESENGEDISNQAVKQRIKEIISSEDPTKPLNDDQITDMLRQEGIRIARRTIAKYREQLGIPIARLRKKI
ncbi:MAG: RNA polymerase factor sigma-54 [Bacteroidetes bacterium]|nr:RNA polymerase factor sigma-54 [Bacteroidota bacterium]